MPYIKQKARDELMKLHIAITDTPIKNAGELNFIITQLIMSYLHHNNIWGYQQINDIIGALECAKTEFQRRVVAEFENKKIEENGDVY